MKKSIQFTTLFTFIFILSFQTSNAQLKGMLNKIGKKKKKAKTEVENKSQSTSATSATSQIDGKAKENFSLLLDYADDLDYKINHFFKERDDINNAVQFESHARYIQGEHKAIWLSNEGNRCKVPGDQNFMTYLFEGSPSQMEKDAIKFADNYTSYITKIKKFPEMYKQHFEEHIFFMIQDQIEQAYQNQEENRPQAIKILKTTTEFMNFFSEANFAPAFLSLEKVNQAKNDLAEATKAIAGEYFAEIFVNDFHKANANKMFFSKTPINPKTANASTFTTDFTVNDPIYGILYLDAKLEDTKICYKYGCLNTVIYVDGKKIKMSDTDPLLSDADQKNAYWLFDVKPDPKKAIYPKFQLALAEILANSSPRRHAVKLEVAKEAIGTITGEFSINLAGMNKEQVITNSKEAEKAAKANKEEYIAKNRGIHNDFKTPNYYKHKFRDPILSTQNIYAMYRKFNPNCGNIEKMVVVTDNPGGKDWKVRTNAFGVIQYRQTNIIGLSFTDKSGKCYYDFVAVNQQYQGGYESPTLIHIHSDGPFRFNCSMK